MMEKMMELMNSRKVKMEKMMELMNSRKIKDWKKDGDYHFFQEKRWR